MAKSQSFLNSACSNIQKLWPLYAALASAFMLAAAHAFETFMHLPPCILCLHQREVYWVALTIAIIGFLITQKWKSASIARAIDALLGIIFLASAAVSFFHSGVELKWWKGLPGCSASGNQVSSDLLGALSQSMQPASCDSIPWSFIGLSMANWNVIISIALAAVSLICAFKGDTGSAELDNSDN